MNAVETLILLKTTPGTLDKKNIIRENNSELLETIFRDTYDESRKYNVKKYTAIESQNAVDLGYYNINDYYEVFHDLLEKLSNKEIAGNEAVEEVGRVIGWFDPKERWILDGVLQRNLKVGVSLDNYNDAVGKKTIRKYEVALADKFFDLTPEKQNEVVMSGKYLISRKLDGVRCTIHYDSLMDEVVFLSRQGKRFTTLDNLIPSIKDILKGTQEPVVLDGEICIVDENGNENFRGLMSEVTRKNHTIAHPKFMWFDMLTLSQFVGHSDSPSFSSRFNIMLDYYYHSSRPSDVHILQQHQCTCWDDFDDWSKMVDENGWEGFMLRKDAPYKSGRSKDLLKVKKMQDAEYIVEDVVVGKVSYNEGGVKEYDAVSSLVINHKGNKVYVGSGLSKEQRLGWYEHPEEIIGKTITVQYFEETQDKKTGEYSLRFPILKVVYEDGRNV